MGRGRAKAKQTKVARDLKYSTHGIDINALQAEFTGARPSAPTPAAPSSEADDSDDADDPYAKYVEDDTDEADEADG
jgi:Protein of unknown function (DUF3073)